VSLSPSAEHRRVPRWLRVIPGIALVVAPVLVSMWSLGALVANNPVLPFCLVLALLVGGWLLATGLRARPAPRSGRARTTMRVLAAAGGIGAAAVLLWLTPFLATEKALAALGSDAVVTVTDTRTDTVYEPASPRAGLVLYPGARVDPRAYAVLARAIASDGFRVVVPKCPFDLELLCPNAADRFVDGALPWAVGGHSLGGVAAAAYADAHGSVTGLVLWASYPVNDMSGRDGLAVASITGTQDGLSTPAKVEERKPLLPVGAVFTPIEGAVHAFFGDYGDQPGDGTPTISRDDAQRQIVAATVTLLERISAAGS
jgi:hypothetical protein